MAALGPQVAVTWFTDAAATGPAIRLAVSRNGGESFADVLTLDQDAPAGRSTVAILECGVVLVAWFAEDDGDFLLKTAVVLPDGGFSVANVDRIPAGRRAGFPRMAASRDTALLAWTVPGGGGEASRVRSMQWIATSGPDGEED